MQTLILEHKPADGSLAELIASYTQAMQCPATGETQVRLLLIAYQHIPGYLPNPEPIPLVALVYLRAVQGYVTRAASCLPNHKVDFGFLSSSPSEAELRDYVARQELPWLDLAAPLRLEPVYIPKPWGQEIWYTGIEARGQSRVSDGRFSLPLPWVLDLLQSPEQAPVTLLKVLDPFPDEVRGDLYFELHEIKQEVYVVTAIDADAWPQGAGQIQMGFCQAKRAQLGSDDNFRQAYLAAVDDYRQVRQELDRLLDQGLVLAELPASLLAREQQLRRQMNSFVAHRPLQVGDVVRVPCYLPHALQHGVQVVEFQTPVYERKILSFAQKVLTQNHWDTAQAMAMATLDAPQPELFQTLHQGADYTLELLAEFGDFEVLRLATHQPLPFPLVVQSTQVLMLIQGELAMAPSSQAKAHGALDHKARAWLLLPGMDTSEWQLMPGCLMLLARPASALPGGAGC